MSIATIRGVMDLIRANTVINDYFTAQYNKSPRHLLGYKSTPGANDLPALCYVPVKELINNHQPGSQFMSIVICINDNRSLDANGAVIDTAQIASSDVVLFSGLVCSDAIKEFCLETIVNQVVADSFIVGAEFKINTDLSLGFPFFQTEISFEVKTINQLRR